MGIMNDTGLSSNAKTYNQHYYQKRKAEVQEEAIEYSYSDEELSYGELAYWGDYFEKLGRRYGLLREFRENGII